MAETSIDISNHVRLKNGDALLPGDLMEYTFNESSRFLKIVPSFAGAKVWWLLERFNNAIAVWRPTNNVKLPSLTSDMEMGF